jgi:uridine kinase
MAIVEDLAEHISALSTPGVLRVAVDGVDGVGKTTFADRLAAALEDRGRSVIRSSVDGFHNPRAHRYRLGRASPEGFYRDSYNYELLRRLLLDPLSPSGSRRYRTAAFDHLSDSPAPADERVAEPGAILVFDGLFLHRPELRGDWDFSIFLDAPFEITGPRSAGRGPGFGDPDPAAPSNRRYVEGNLMYFREAAPRERATVVLDHSDLDRHRVVSWRR